VPTVMTVFGMIMMIAKGREKKNEKKKKTYLRACIIPDRNYTDSNAVINLFILFLFS
jgi:hypothetical protein